MTRQQSPEIFCTARFGGFSQAYGKTNQELDDPSAFVSEGFVCCRAIVRRDSLEIQQWAGRPGK